MLSDAIEWLRTSSEILPFQMSEMRRKYRRIETYGVKLRILSVVCVYL